MINNKEQSIPKQLCPTCKGLGGIDNPSYHGGNDDMQIPCPDCTEPWEAPNFTDQTICLNIRE